VLYVMCGWYGCYVDYVWLHTLEGKELSVVRCGNRSGVHIERTKV